MSSADADSDWYHLIDFSVRSSTEPAVNFTLENVYPVTPTSLVWFAPGSSEPRDWVTEPIESELFTVCVAPTIGNVPRTVAAVFTATTASDGVSPDSVARLPVVSMFAPTITVFVVPAGIVKSVPTVARCSEFKVFSMPMSVPSSFMSTMPEKEVSAARPCRSTTTLLTVTGPSFPAVKRIFVNGTRAAFSGAREFAGWSAAFVTVSPVPAGTTTGVVGVVGVVETAPEHDSFIFARVIVPK